MAVRGDVNTTRVLASIGKGGKIRAAGGPGLAVAVAVLLVSNLDWGFSMLVVDLSTVRSAEFFDKGFEYHREAQADQVWSSPPPSPPFSRQVRVSLAFLRPVYSAEGRAELP